MTRWILAALTCLAVLAPVAQAGSLTVYSNNVENLPEPTWPDCKGDFNGLLSYMTGRPPDVFLVQQMPNLATLRTYVDAMTKATNGVPYVGTIADEDPKGQKTRCTPNSLKAQQTNAIIWREDVLTPIESSAVSGVPRCRNEPAKVSKTLCYPSVFYQGGGPSPGCAVNQQTRTENAVLRLRHQDGSTFTFASIHWPSGKAGKPNQEKFPKGRNGCAQVNAAAAKAAVSADADALRIFGGDANIKGSDPWRQFTQRRLGFSDVIGIACKRAKQKQTERCLRANPTSGSKRIDFMFAQRGDGSAPTVTDARTIDYGDVPGFSGFNYSEHRAIVTTFGY